MNIKIYDDEKLTDVNENLKLIEKKEGLTFGTDAYLLSAFIEKKSRSFAVELGCGSGIISLLLVARNKISNIYAIDVQKEFAELTGRNAILNGFENRITAIQKNVKDLSVDCMEKEADIVFSNPPYMKTTSGKRNENDMKYIARHETEGNIYDFCACASRILKFGGLFYTVYRPDRIIDLFDALRKNALEPKELLFVQSKTTSAPSMVLVKSKKGASPSLKILPNLFLNNDNDSGMTETAKKIYENCEIVR